MTQDPGAHSSKSLSTQKIANTTKKGSTVLQKLFFEAFPVFGLLQSTVLLIGAFRERKASSSLVVN